MGEELKPCPECNGMATLRASSDGDAEWVQCDGCGYAGKVCLAEAEAVAAWNDRVPREVSRSPYHRIAALIEAGDRLNELACHQDDCQIVTHGVWSDPIPCSCGYTEAWKKWKEVRGE